MTFDVFFSRGFSELQHCKIMSYFAMMPGSWKEDLLLKEDSQKYVGQFFKREEILSFVIRDYYTWRILFYREHRSPV